MYHKMTETHIYTRDRYNTHIYLHANFGHCLD